MTIMARNVDSYVIDNNGDCELCHEESPPEKSLLTCANCQRSFHALCSLLDKDSQPCSVTFLESFLRSTVKTNFKWYCDTCLIILDNSSKSSLADAVAKLTRKVEVLHEDIEDLKNVGTTPVSNQISGASNGGALSDINSVNKLRSSFLVKTKPDKQKLTKDDIRKVIVDNKLPVNSVGESKKGNYFIHCPSVETRDELQKKFSELDTQIVHPLMDKEPTISIVGITEPFTDKVELTKRIMEMNPKVKTLNDDGQTFVILFMRAPNGPYTNFQVVARVGPKIRDVIRANYNRLYVGCELVRIYDRFHVKRCNKYNEFGHFIKDCQKSSGACGTCAGEDHESKDCRKKDSTDVGDLNCINCKRAGQQYNGHRATSFKCPAYIQAQKKIKGTIPYYDSQKNWNHLPRY